MINEMLKKIANEVKDYLFGETARDVHSSEEGKIELRYKDLVIGILTLHQGMWRFEYSEAFKSQTELAPLIDFPNKDKVYESPTLFPFFMSRIPSLKQPKVQSVIEAEHIDATSELAMLKRFGERSIANPFVLSV